MTIDPGSGFATAADLAAAIRGGELSAVDAYDLHVARLSRLNPSLNAVVIPNPQARDRALAADAALARGESWGLLHGVPVTIKDIFDVQGLRNTAGYLPARDNVSTTNATVVQRVLDAGAVILGKTNVPLLCYDWQCDSPIFGRTNNPWNLDRTPGGSTGGGAAALAAGLTPLEIGSDAAGSIRIPAHFCGVFGLKPTEHRVSGAGHGELPGAPPRGLRHMVSFGPLARNVADLRLALTLLEGPDGRHSEVPPVPPIAPMREPPAAGEVRIAWMDALPQGPVASETAHVVRAAAASLEAAGCTVERIGPPDFDLQDALELWGEINGFEMGVMTPAPIRMLLRHGTYFGLGRTRWTRGLRGGLAMDPKRFVRALAARDGMIAALELFLDRFDAWMLPVSPTAAFPHMRSGKPILIDGVKVAYTTAVGAYSAPFNLTGNPVVTVPAGQTSDGMPVGVQLIGRRWGDDALLATAERVSLILGPFRAPPGY
ncbi:MAG TPA: amidase [Gemmatimonadales bacterium]|nr:amidase [Gemmatimonadales bacterium]